MDPKPTPNRSQTYPKPMPNQIQTDPKPTPNRPQNDPKPTKNLVPSSWNQVLGTKYLVPITWYGTKYAAPGGAESIESKKCCQEVKMTPLVENYFVYRPPNKYL